MIQFSDYAIAKETEIFQDSDLIEYPFSNKASLTLAQTFRLAEHEKKLQVLGQKLADSKISAKEIVELEDAMNEIVNAAIPTLPESRIEQLPVALKIKIIQTWQAPFLAQ